jgi:hypothetical protein
LIEDDKSFRLIKSARWIARVESVKSEKIYDSSPFKRPARLGEAAANLFVIYASWINPV